MPLDVTIGPCRVIEIKTGKGSGWRNWKNSISRGANGFSSRRTIHRGCYKSEKFVEDYVYLDVEAAKYLVSKEIILFGLDNITIGSFKEHENLTRTHETLLGAGLHSRRLCPRRGAARRLRFAVSAAPHVERRCRPLPGYPPSFEVISNRSVAGRDCSTIRERSSRSRGLRGGEAPPCCLRLFFAGSARYCIRKSRGFRDNER